MTMNLMEWDTAGNRHATLTGGVLHLSATEGWQPTTKLLLRGGRFTNSGLLLEVASRCGVTVIVRHRGFSNYDELAFLERIGLLETGKLSGPHGGKVWSLTDRGAAVLAHLQQVLESTS